MLRLNDYFGTFISKAAIYSYFCSLPETKGDFLCEGHYNHLLSNMEEDRE